MTRRSSSPLDAAHIRRQMRFDPLPLFIAQPKQIPAHDPDPLPKTNQDRIVTAEKLMSSDPSIPARCAWEYTFCDDSSKRAKMSFFAIVSRVGRAMGLPFGSDVLRGIYTSQDVN